MVIGAVPEQAAAILLLGVVGIGNALIDVGGFTLLARLADETVLARMFAGFEAILTLGVAAGGFVAPLVVDLLGVRPALVAIGLLAPLAVAASWPALRRLDARCTCATRTSRPCGESACWVRSRWRLSNSLLARSSTPTSILVRPCSGRASAGSTSTSWSPAVPR